jgi:glycosyltransferase involved in cell wall biosynthesis
MKVFQISTYFEHKGGTEASMLELATALEERGHQVGFIYHHKTNNTLSLSQFSSYHVPVLEAQIWPNVRWLAKLVRIMKEEKVEVVILQNVFNLWTVALLSRLVPTVRFVRSHEMYCMGLNRTAEGFTQECLIPHSYACIRNCRQDLLYPLRVVLYLYRKAEIRANRGLERLLVTSSYMRRNLLLNGFLEEKVEVVPPFLNLEATSPPPSSSRIALFVGRLEEIKGTKLLPELAKLLPHGAKLMVVGDGELKDELQQAVAGGELQEKLLLRGRLNGEELLRAYTDAQVVIVPSMWQEPFGRVGIEALAMGRPVIAFDVGGVQDWLTDGETGFLVPRGDVQKLAEFASLLLENGDLASEMGRKGHERARTLFGREQAVSRLEQILATAIQSWRRRTES